MLALSLLARMPWQAWAVAATVALGALWHWREVSRSYEAGRASVEQDAIKDINERLRNAVEADGRARSGNAGDGLRDDDGHRRD